MPIKIRRLNCRVRVKTGGKGSLLHKGDRPARPTMAFAMPEPEPEAEGMPAPSETATQERGGASEKEIISPARADPRLVTDRVYDLMKQEIQLAQLRGGKQWRN